MNGLHLTADLHDCRCDSAWLLDAAQLGSACRSAEAVSAARLMKLLNILGVEWVLQNRSEPTVPASGETSDW